MSRQIITLTPPWAAPTCRPRRTAPACGQPPDAARLFRIALEDAASGHRPARRRQRGRHNAITGPTRSVAFSPCPSNRYQPSIFGAMPVVFTRDQPSTSRATREPSGCGYRLRPQRQRPRARAVLRPCIAITDGTASPPTRGPMVACRSRQPLHSPRLRHDRRGDRLPRGVARPDRQMRTRRGGGTADGQPKARISCQHQLRTLSGLAGTNQE
jgi:hypothetical protein